MLLYSCRPLLLATFNPDEGALRPHLLDRIAVTLSADAPPSLGDRVAAVEAALSYQQSPVSVVAQHADAAQDVKLAVSLPPCQPLLV